jgi:2-polyprenyl-3-methyl-5-hydroxy-6-metoxy-1,4-benzoquinol methylase
MARVVSYAEQTLDSPNPITRFAHRSRYRISLDLADRLLPQGGLMVDFGAGEGAFLNKFAQRRPDARLLAIEPYMELRYPGIDQVAQLAEVAPGSVDLVGVFEVLEHVSDADLASFFRDAVRALKPGGALLVTVPIMYGLALPVKAVASALLHRRRIEFSLPELAKGTLGIPIPRPASRSGTHKGFDFRWLDREITSAFAIRKRSFSPFPKLPWWCNSQAVMIAAKRAG